MTVSAYVGGQCLLFAQGPLSLSLFSGLANSKPFLPSFPTRNSWYLFTDLGSTFTLTHIPLLQPYHAVINLSNKSGIDSFLAQASGVQ